MNLSKSLIVFKERLHDVFIFVGFDRTSRVDYPPSRFYYSCGIEKKLRLAPGQILHVSG